MAKIVHPAHGRGLVQAFVAKHMLKMNLKLGVQPKDPDVKEKLIANAAKDLGDTDLDRARQVTNYLFNPKHAKGRSLQEMVDRLKAGSKGATKAPAKKASAKKAVAKKAKAKSSRPAPAATEDRAAAA